MTRFGHLALFLVCTAIGCVSRSSDAPDSAATGDHDPSLHAEHAAGGRGQGDSAFTALQARGATGMGVDQYTSSHTFEPLPTGGRITLRREVDDSAGVEQIRAHLGEIAASFAAGDFTTPGFVHAGAVPGVVSRDGLPHRGLLRGSPAG